MSIPSYHIRFPSRHYMTPVITQSTKSGFQVLVIATACLGVSGCVSSSSTKLVNSYSSAAGSLDTAITQTYSEAQQSEAANRIASALNDPDTGYQHFSEVKLKTTSIEARTKLADELLSYSKNLQALVSDQASSNLTTQSQALFTNLSSLNASLGTITGSTMLKKTDLAILATAIDAIGQAWLQSERLKLVTQIVEKADPLVQQASNLYVEDLPNWEGFELAALQNASENYFNIAQKKISPPGVPPSFPDPNTRVELLQKADDARSQAESLDAKFKSIKDAIQKCAKAHAAILASLKSDAELKNSTGVVSDFVTSVENVYTFYKGVSK